MNGGARVLQGRSYCIYTHTYTRTFNLGIYYIKRAKGQEGNMGRYSNITTKHLATGSSVVAGAGAGSECCYLGN
jgi:hypothetical protein